MSGNGKCLLDWISTDVDIISFILQPLPDVKNQQSFEQFDKTTFLINPEHMIEPHDSLYKLIKPF